MSIASVSDLRNVIADYLDDDTLSTQVDDFIARAEARHRREIRLREMLTRASLTVDARNVSLPTGFLEAINIRLLTNPVTVLYEVSLHQMTVEREDSTGKPRYYTIASDIEFDYTPDQSYSGEITYYQELDALDDVTTSNTLLTTYPDAYLFAALAEGFSFQMDEQRAAFYEAKYAATRDAINAQAASSRRVGPLVSRINGSTP
jgi:hypothetical protein